MKPLKLTSDHLFSPILGKPINTLLHTNITLDAKSAMVIGFQTYHNKGLENCIKHQLTKANASIGIGGYLEKRNIYQGGTSFNSDSLTRNIHLGIDIWADAHTKIFAPLEGVIHSFKNNDKPFDYGGTIILEHNLDNTRFYTLYGHLSTASLEKRYKNQVIKAGECLATLGEEYENGGWYPHLHFQVIYDLEGQEGDYPGVCAEKDLAFYTKNCPNPSTLIR